MNNNDRYWEQFTKIPETFCESLFKFDLIKTISSNFPILNQFYRYNCEDQQLK